MKRPNITPGAWRQNKVAVKHDIYDVLDSEGETIAFIPVADKGNKHAKPNGQAIASVPKLLEAMEDLIPFADVDLEPDELTVEVPIEKLMKLKFALQDAGYTFD